LCDTLDVSRSGFYKHLDAKLTDRSEENKRIVECIYEVRKNPHKKSYGAPRLKAELLEECGLTVSIKRITKLMKANNIRVNSKKKFKATGSSKPTDKAKENILEQNFKAESKNKIWVTDITYIWTREGWLYLSCILDLWSKKIVAYEIQDSMTTKLVSDTLTKAYLKESPNAGLIIHSDQGSQYTSNEYARLVNKLGLTHSMSRRGNCYDNAVIESFHATLKKEMVYLEGVICMKEMKLKIFDYIEGFYNRERRHSSLGNMSPLNFEKMFEKSEERLSTILT